MKYDSIDSFINVDNDVLLFHKLCAQVSVNILKKRVEMGMPQKEFAKFMKVTQGMVSKWESGEYNFTLEAIAKICDKLKLDPLLSLKPETPNIIEEIKTCNIELKYKYKNTQVDDLVNLAG